ncbi:M48 family metallopeptidase [Methylophilus sp. 3sh_L]|uniref:M48 family metallopeptidase n=1 Tax=Methylophilus sp. 3sh_L TaxID=3377114 RepID=UPI00398ED0A9
MWAHCKKISTLMIGLFIFNQSCVAEIRQPYADANALQALEPDEQRLWSASNDFEKAIRKGGQIYASPELEAYLQSVMDKLYPEFAGKIKVHVVNSPVLNAFAIPNGNIYMHTGLLSRFDNEAQLATVLAHEGAHFVYRHGYFNQQSVKGSSAFATITAVIGVPIVGLIGNIIATSSIYGYSRELETEADNMGFNRLIKAGYDPSEAHKVFEHLAKEVKLSDVQESFFYSTHPKLKDRVDNFTKLAALHPNSGVMNTEQYSANVDKLRMESLEQELSFGRYKHVIALLSDETVLQRYPSTVHYYLGEAYRKRNEKEDAEIAMREFDKTIALNASFAPAYRARGLLLMSQNKTEQAISMFRRYLELAPEASDQSYVNGYLETLAKQ